MTFLRVVEIFPPSFPISHTENGGIGLEEKTESFVEGVRSIRDLADVFLVASVKNPQLWKLSTVEAARILQERLRVEAAPVIIVRDMSRPQYLSTILTAISMDLGSMMIAWGDKYPAGVGATNVLDYSSLSLAIRDASSIRARARAPTRIFAPVDIGPVGHPKGIGLAKSRLEAGADLLLAQPPSIDSAALDTQASKLEESGMKDKVLLNVFPFKDRQDLDYCEKYFGWTFPERFRKLAELGESALLDEERNVVRRLRNEGFPGLYVSTRGNPSVARRMLS